MLRVVGEAERAMPVEPPARAPLGRPGVAWRGDGALGGARQAPAAGLPGTLAALGFRPGALPLRVLASALDFAVLVVLLAIAYSVVAQLAGIDSTLPRDEIERALRPLMPLLYTVTVAVYLAYQTLCNTAGSSPGKRICGLRIIDARGRPPGLRRGLVRALWSLASSVPPFLGYLAVTWDREHRAWHDRLSGTWVVRARRN